MENKKYYTFINTQNCVGNNNKTYVGVTAIVNVSNVELKMTPNGVSVAAGRAAINNRTKTLSTALGVEIKDTNGTVWVDVNVWQDRAERFANYIGDRKNVRLCLVGQLTYTEFPKADGTTGQRVAINVNDWAPVGATTQNGDTKKSSEPDDHDASAVPSYGEDDLPY